MNDTQKTNGQPASAVAVISQRLAGLGLFPSAPGDTAAELFKTAGVCFATSAANVVGSLANSKLSGAQKRRAATEALKMAAVADACMAHAAAVAKSPGKVPSLSGADLANIKSCLDDSAALSKLSSLEIISAVLNSDAADYLVVIELLNRLLPGWYDLPDATFAPTKSATGGAS